MTSLNDEKSIKKISLKKIGKKTQAREIDRSHSGFVYLIAQIHPKTKKHTGLYKIGWGETMKKVFEGLKRQSHPLKEIASYWSPDAYHDEKMLHDYFSQYHFNGEWFELKDLHGDELDFYLEYFPEAHDTTEHFFQWLVHQKEKKIDIVIVKVASIISCSFSELLEEENENLDFLEEDEENEYLDFLEEKNEYMDMTLDSAIEYLFARCESDEDYNSTFNFAVNDFVDAVILLIKDEKIPFEYALRKVGDNFWELIKPKVVIETEEEFIPCPF